MHVERIFAVQRPIDEVFDYLADFTHTEEWDPGTVSTTRRSGDGGLGTTYDNVSELLGRRVELVYSTVTHAAPRRVRFRGRQRWSTTLDDLALRDLGDGRTEIQYRADFSFGFPISLAAPFVVRPKLGDLADETVASLRRALER